MVSSRRKSAHPLVSQVETVLERSAGLEALRSQSDAGEQLSFAYRRLADAALELAQGLHEELALLVALDERFSSKGLIALLLDLPQQLSAVGETEHALRVARAFQFSAPDDLRGDIALIHARAGRREEALAQVAVNLEAAAQPYLVEAKAGDVYRALGEYDAAEAYYRRALTEAKTESERAEAALRITSLLIDTGREVEAADFVREQSVVARSRR